MIPPQPITVAQRRSSWSPTRHPQEDLCSALHFLLCSLQTWIGEVFFGNCFPSSHLALSDFGLINLATAGSGGPHSSLSLSTRSPSPPSCWENIHISDILYCCSNLESQTGTTAEVCHTFTPFLNNTSGGEFGLMLFDIIQISPSILYMCYLYTSKNSSAWWKVRR